eukprot:366212-Chlamydomonas_euryale.AAC.31
MDLAHPWHAIMHARMHNEHHSCFHDPLPHHRMRIEAELQSIPGVSLVPASARCERCASRPTAAEAGRDTIPPPPLTLSFGTAHRPRPPQPSRATQQSPPRRRARFVASCITGVSASALLAPLPRTATRRLQLNCALGV